MAAVYACLNKNHFPVVEVGDMWPEDFQIKGYIRRKPQEMQVISKLDSVVNDSSILLCSNKRGNIREVVAIHLLSFSCQFCN